MRLSVLGCAIASALVWGGAVFVVALINWTSSGYGEAFLEVVSSVYPGFHIYEPSFVNSQVGLGYALLDGFVGGLVFSWLYNRFASPAPASAPTR